MSQHEEILREFIIETLECLDNLDRHLVTLEESPRDTATLNEVFRILHTIKGTCGFLDLFKLEKISHCGESLLDEIRCGRIAVDAEVTTGLLCLVDTMRALVVSLETSGLEGETEVSTLAATLEALRISRNPNKKQQIHKVEADTATAPESLPEEDDLEKIFLEAKAEADRLLASESAAPDLPTLRPEPVQTTAEPVRREPKTQELEKSSSGPGLSETSLRVDVSLLDQLMTLVGELVLARNQILQFTKSQSDSSFISTSQRLNSITSELQESVMKTRMQPIATIWDKFPRVVRDVALACGKEVRIESIGRETDLDKTIIEAIKDPLTHIVRNSVDHGIEQPDARIAAGKDREGCLTLRAFHEGGHVIIEVADDGAGLRVEKIIAKALERGIVRAEQAAHMTDDEAFQLIFHAGFSTAEQVTNISGRGVGMDVVRSNIERIGGSVDITSVAEKGTTLKIRIPLTLAIVPALMVSCGGEQFAIPQVNLLELVRISGAQIYSEIEEIQGALFYRLRGSLLPLVYLDYELQIGSVAPCEEIQDRAINIVVVKADDRQFGLVVHAVHDTQEIVVKPLAKQLKEIEVFAGATILGNGKVALIIDVPGLAKRANIRAESVRVRHEAVVDQVSRQSLLIVNVGRSYRVAIPLELVHRLEKFPRTKVEQTGSRSVIQYRGGILPLIDLADHLHTERERQQDTLHVIVHTSSAGSVGLIVDTILDIVDERTDIALPSSVSEVRGTIVIQGKVTDILEVSAFLPRIASPVTSAISTESAGQHGRIQ